jgi:uncharacterized repeat protein (TIGR01451 family)
MRREWAAVSVLGLLLVLLCGAFGPFDLLPLDSAGAAESADLVLTMTGSRTPANTGEAVLFIYKVKNAGPSTAAAVELKEELPESASVTVIRHSGACTPSGHNYICELGSLASGATREYEVELSDSNPEYMSPAGRVTSTTPDPETQNNVQYVFTNVLAAPEATEADLTLHLTDSKDPVTVGEPFLYTERVDNAGPQAAKHVGVSDFIPAEVEVLDEEGCNYVEGQVYCELGEIVAGGHAEATFKVAVPGGPGTVVNEATINATSNYDPHPADDGASQSTTVVAGSGGATADLNVGIAASKSAVTVGEPFTYTVAVGNAGPDPAEEVEATVTLPSSLEVKGSDPNCSTVVGSVHCEVGTVAAGTSVAEHFSVVPTVAGPVSVEAKVKANATDPNPADDTATLTTEVKAAPAPPPSGPPTPPITANLTPQIPKTPLGQYAVIETHVGGPATEARFKVDGNNSFRTPTATPYVGFSFSSPGTHTISETIFGAGGQVFTSSTIIQVTAGANSKVPFRSIPGFLPDLAIASNNIELFERAAKEANCAPGTTVIFGVVEAEGCFSRIETAQDIPPSERELVNEYYSTSQLVEHLTNNACSLIRQLQCHSEYLTKGPLDSKPYVSRQPIKVNGMTIEPVGGDTIVVFPALSRIVSSKARITYDGGVFKNIPVRPTGPLNLDLSTGVQHLNASNAQLPLFEFDTSQAFKDIGGFPINGKVQLYLKKEGEYRSTELQVNVSLPEDISTAAGADPTALVQVDADNKRGTYLNHLNFHIGEAFLGPVRLANLDFTYNDAGEPAQRCPSKWWKATAEVFFIPVEEEGGGAGIRMAPEPQRNGVAFCAGSFHSAGAELKFGDPIPPPEIFPGVTLNAIEFDFQVQKPVLFDGGVTIKAAETVTAVGGFLAAFATPTAPYTVRPSDAGGTLKGLAGQTYRSPIFAVGGQVFIEPYEDVNLELGSAYLLYNYPDFIAAHGSAHLQTFLFAINASAGLELDAATRKFNALLEGEVCLAGGIKIAGIGACVGGEARVSSRGLSVCFNFGHGTWTPGVGDVYGHFPEFFLGFAGDGCKPSHFWEKNVRSADALILASNRQAVGQWGDHRAAAHASAAGPLTFTVAKGETGKSVELVGSGGAPAVTVSGPGGTITTKPDEMFREGDLSALAASKYERTWLGLENAKPGVYKITPAPGSAPIVNLRETRLEPNAGVKASVTGSGRKLVLHYDAGHAHGQKVTFLERGKGTYNPIKTVSGGSGTVAFTPSFGPGGKRTIAAQVEVDGIPAPLQTLAHFKAPPPPKAQRVGGVRVVRHGAKLAVSWDPVPYAQAYGVVVSAGGGAVRSLRVKPARHAATLKSVPTDAGGTVEVVAFSPLGERGKPGRTTFKATTKPTSRLLPYDELGEATPFAKHGRKGGKGGKGDKAKKKGS